ncbi:MAG: dTMP kinase [Planctomycetota bacterium]|nr:dTMP kinase [Planctomycetota bacterium]
MPDAPGNPSATPPAIPSAGQPPEPWLAALAGKFLVFEGPDGCGKSTQLANLVALAQNSGLTVASVREPGGTDIGERVRTILLDRESRMSLQTEMLLYMASRSQLVAERILPALERGEVVIADRFVASTYAYQGAGGGLPRADIDAVARVVLQQRAPDLTLIFDVDEQTALIRRRGLGGGGALKGRGKKPRSGFDLHEATLFDDRIESRETEFHRRVRASYLEQAAADPAHIAVIDARGTPEQVWKLTTAELGKRFKRGQ